MKPIAGALINNFYMMNTRLTRLYMLAIPVLVLAYITTENLFAAAMLPFFLVMGLSSASLENASVPFSTKWTAFENSWGLSPHLMVISRYLLYIISTAIGLALWLVLPFEFYSTAGPGITLTHYIIMGQLTCIVYYPIVYLLNPKQDSTGLIVLFASIGLSIAATFGIEMLAGDSYLLIAAIVAVLYVVSAAISIGFSAMHRGRVA